jgi:hypothetical protein
MRFVTPTRSRLGFSPVLFAMVCLALCLGSRAASAGCDPRNFAQVHVKVPAFINGDGWGPPTIVGLWHAEFTSAAVPPFDHQSFDVWHADGTEFETADLPPPTGAVCVGVWKQRGNTVELNHFGWTWDATGTTPTGSFELLETITVSPKGNAYTGTFVFQTYDVEGNAIPGAITGNIAATRITLETRGAN